MKDQIDLEQILREVQKPGRYVGGEWNTVQKNPQEVKARIALVFPDLYEIGMTLKLSCELIRFLCTLWKTG